MTANGEIKIMVVEDHAILRSGLVALVDRQNGMRVVAEADNGRQAVEEFRAHQPDVTLMDLRMPILDGVEAITAIRREFPHSRFIVLTTYDGDEDIHRALRAGASAYLLKGMKREELFDAIAKVAKGLRYIPDNVEKSLHESERPNLTSRELEVLQLIVDGLSNREIAGRLNTTEGTVKSYLNKIFSKLAVNDRTKAVITAIKRGIIR